MSGLIPLFANAKQIIPGMIKRKTGVSFKKAANIEPRLASFSFGAPNMRCTMYWSVHQYHNPIMGAQSNIPGHGYLSLKYQACLPASFTGAQVASTPSGTTGFHKLNISLPQISFSLSHPPSACNP